MPPALRCLLHRTVHQFTHPRHATRQTGGGGLCAVGRRFALQDFWFTVAPSGVCIAAAYAGDVWSIYRAGFRLFKHAGNADTALIALCPGCYRNHYCVQ